MWSTTAKNSTAVKLTNTRNKPDPNSKTFSIHCDKNTVMEVIDVDFPHKSPVETQLMYVEQIKSLGPKQHVTKLQATVVKLSHRSDGVACSAKPLAPSLSGHGFESWVEPAQTPRGTVARSGADVAFVPDVASSVGVRLESETCVCSFSSELLFVFELLRFRTYLLFRHKNTPTFLKEFKTSEVFNSSAEETLSLLKTNSRRAAHQIHCRALQLRHDEKHYPQKQN
ncbi:hypothetical protein G5714_002687 [Onychostoma macrolepis]|uniref:Uncharacterized protein n=1 Tax=Onychostoma macrolepis TaxID=369639 RepID=A0A7J6D7E0_9TELE|nr:hypothetical protein G5714_002687 [Onychostoma macrolepis]